VEENPADASKLTEPADFYQMGEDRKEWWLRERERKKREIICASSVHAVCVAVWSTFLAPGWE
jgi:hypothetical protein